MRERKNQQQRREYEQSIRQTRHGVSGNHLLNFSLPDRDHERHGYSQKKKKYVPPRAQIDYLLANFRFVITPFPSDYDISYQDVDSLIEWKSIEQVLLWKDQATELTCPICLDDFRVPKITKCGHIFCWPCILRYLSMTENYWRRCPMCFESVQKSHLRSVRIDIVELPPRVNSKVTFQVLDRAKGSLFPVVRDREINSSDGHSNKIPIVYDKDAKFSRILESTSEYITQLLLQEMHQLEEVEKEYKSCGDFETIPFVQEAIEFTSKRLLGKKEPSKKSTQGKRESVSQKKKSNRNSIMEAKNHKDNVYTFYQLENGCYVVLHPLTMKCLTKEFIDKKPFVANEQEQLADSWIEQIPSSSSPSDATGSSKLEGFLPCQVTAKVVEVEHIVMDEDAERRYRFLNHLPMLSDFYLCELDLRGIVSQETLDFFKPELKKREKQRKAKAMKNLKESPSSPIFKLRQQDFNLQAHDQVSWPAPTPNDNNMDPNTQDLPDTFIESFEHGTQLLEGVESDNLAASPSFSASSSIYNEESSFATITRQSGYFPSLSNSVSSSSSRTNTGTTSSPSWVVPHQPLVDYSDPSITDQIKKNKKKSGKKGVSLFSTAQRRSYR